MRVLAHLSDLHFGRTDQRVVDGLLADLHGIKPDLVIISGDFVQRARLSHFRQARAFLRQLPCPFLAVPGNHDIPVWNVLARFISPYLLYRHYIARNLNPVHVDDELAIVGLNTSRPFIDDFAEGRMNAGQMARVEAVLAPLGPEVFKILVTHHPFLPPPDSPLTRTIGRQRLAVPIIERTGIDLLLAGHLHRAYVGNLASRHQGLTRPVLVAQASTATSDRLRGESNGYNRILVDLPTVTLELRGWDGAAFSPLRAVQHRRVAGQWVEQALPIQQGSPPSA